MKKVMTTTQRTILDKLLNRIQRNQIAQSLKNPKSKEKTSRRQLMTYKKKSKKKKNEEKRHSANSTNIRKYLVRFSTRMFLKQSRSKELMALL